MSSHSYSLTERWLHWLALEPASVRQLSFDLERNFALPRRAGMPDPAAHAIYVCGLARSGTTLLLHLLAQVDDLRSLSYRDMPFPLAPNLWRRISSFAQRKAVAAPRIHGDGMLVDFDSPEGFEEVFWRTFTRYSANGAALSTTPPSREAMEAFADYRALIANPRGREGNGATRRYLSKNNNNLLRLQLLCDEDAANVVLVYRDPLAAARSMHRTHAGFGHEQAKSDYMRRYMGWLCHYEFGLDHRPFGFAAGAMDPRLQPSQLDYWLDYWCAVHEYILRASGPALHLLDYDTLCRSPMQTLDSLFDVLNIKMDCEILAAQIKPYRAEVEQNFDRALLRRAEGIHRALRERMENVNRIVAA